MSTNLIPSSVMHFLQKRGLDNNIRAVELNHDVFRTNLGAGLTTDGAFSVKVNKHKAGNSVITYVAYGPATDNNPPVLESVRNWQFVQPQKNH